MVIITCSANYAIRRTSTDHGENFDEAVVGIILRSFYMDDVVKSIETKDETIPINKQLKELMRIGTLHLTKFSSIRAFVMDCLPAQNVGQSNNI